MKSILDDLDKNLTTFERITAMQQLVFKAGFVWEDTKGVISKIKEELEEVSTELNKNEIPQDLLKEEVGDLLFTCLTLCGYTNVDFKDSLEGAGSKFERRFRNVEHILHQQGKDIKECTIDELVSIWEEAKNNTRINK